jgi:hypothetical protein
MRSAALLAIGMLVMRSRKVVPSRSALASEAMMSAKGIFAAARSVFRSLSVPSFKFMNSSPEPSWVVAARENARSICSQGPQQRLIGVISFWAALVKVVWMI